MFVPPGPPEGEEREALSQMQTYKKSNSGKRGAKIGRKIKGVRAREKSFWIRRFCKPFRIRGFRTERILIALVSGTQAR
jgi:hypothetical protein